ncbi:hypothetical protein WJX73_000726 [Symbiochloris irregularis]|uniref:Flavanone 4-reductase n=1 Tax=Symbiochloris irregularis TaxID=706552 RepID=A0AAW1P452_9CHLO
MAHVAVVTGASGFIATQLIKQLLEKGYTVRGTVRSTKDERKTEVLHKLAEALPGNLELREADLLKEGSFDDAVAGADFVFHTASPFFNDPEDAQRDLVDPALKGTRNVLNAVIKSKDTVKRVVLTSSVAAVSVTGGKPKNGDRYNEEDWNTGSSVTHEPYRYSKYVAEKEAWTLSKQEGFELVTILPSFVIGPVLGRRQDATSIKALKKIVEGTADTIVNRVIDVRDIARAHILAAELPKASGRYLLSHADTVSIGDVYRELSQRFPQYKYPAFEPEPSKPLYDNSKVQNELGLKLIPVRETLADAANSLYSLGIGTPAHK